MQSGNSDQPQTYNRKMFYSSGERGVGGLGLGLGGVISLRPCPPL